MVEKHNRTRAAQPRSIFGVRALLYQYFFSNRHRYGYFSQLEVVDLKGSALARMQRLRLLQLDYVNLIGDYKAFPAKLRCLSWHGCPLSSIPNYFNLEKLVVLDMTNSRLEQLWKGTKSLESLKILNLSYSRHLTTTPDFSGFPCLERLILKECDSLVAIHESIGELRKLIFLNLKGCENLTKLPVKIGLLKSLKQLILSNCSKLDKLPKELGSMESLEVLHADRAPIEQFTTEETSWAVFPFRKIKKLKSTSFSLAFLPRSLVSLSLVHCNLSDDSIPKNLSCLPSLRSLDLSDNPISSLPNSIKALTMLQSLHLDRCKCLQWLPELPTSLMDLLAKHCTSLERITNLPNLLKSLYLEIFGCEELVEIEGLFTLKPIGSIDREVINGMGFLMESTENLAVQMVNSMTRTTRKRPLQGLYECGIFSFFLPRSKVQCWFTHHGMGSSISFTLSPLFNRKIRGLNLSIVYTFSGFWNYEYEKIANSLYSLNRAYEVLANVHYVVITNETKGLRWTYSPTFYGIPEGNEDMLWLGYWNFGNQLEGGDKVNCSVFMADKFLAKECGINLVYEKDEGATTSNNEVVFQQHANLSNKNDTVQADLSKHQTTAKQQLLCHHRFVSHHVNSKQCWGKRDFDLCFCGVTNASCLICSARPRFY